MKLEFEANQLIGSEKEIRVLVVSKDFVTFTSVFPLAGAWFQTLEDGGWTLCAPSTDIKTGEGALKYRWVTTFKRKPDIDVEVTSVNELKNYQEIAGNAQVLSLEGDFATVATRHSLIRPSTLDAMQGYGFEIMSLTATPDTVHGEAISVFYFKKVK